MTDTYALNDRARRILIALLAFLTGAAVLAILAVGPPAAADDAKNFAVTISDVDEFDVDSIEISDGAAVDVFIEWTNVSETGTQRFGSARGFFDDDFFTINSATIDDAPNGKQTWDASFDNTTGTVEFHANNKGRGDNRVGPLESVTVKVNITPPNGTRPPTIYDISTDVDQEASDPDWGGGNEFLPIPPADPPADDTVHITVVGGIEKACNPTAGNPDCSTGTDQGASTDCFNCKSDGILIVDHQAGICDIGGEFAGECGELWFADYQPDVGPGSGGEFYLIITVPKRSNKIVYEDPANPGVLVVAKNCQPPHRTVLCIDKDLSSGKTFALKLDEDPRGGYR